MVAMIRNNTRSKWVIAIVVLLVSAMAVVWLMRTLQMKNQQLSIKPELSYSDLKLEPVESNIGLQARLPYRSLILAAEHATREPQTGTGENQSCKKVLGAKVCATLKWQYSIIRDGEIRIESQGEQLRLILPLSFSGLVSVDGRGGKLFGLRNKDIDGKLNLIADLAVSINSSWCPMIDSTVSYEWVTDPRITLVGKLRINLRKSVDKALQRKLASLKGKLTDVIDCEEFRQSIQAQWRTHYLDVDMQDSDNNQLVVTPLRAAVSDIGVQQDHVSLAFDLGATVELKQTISTTGIEKTEGTQLQSAALLPLPPLQPHNTTPGSVEFSLLMQIPYEQLQAKLAAKVVGKTFGSGASNALTVTSLGLYPADELLIIDVGFEANAVSIIKIRGNVYISAKPVADPLNDRLILEDLQLTRTIDSRLMSALTTILRQQLIDALQKESVIDLRPSLAKIESSVEEALSNPEKTAGIQVDVLSPEVRLMALNPQADGVAAIVHLSTRLNATIPEDVLIR